MTRAIAACVAAALIAAPLVALPGCAKRDAGAAAVRLEDGGTAVDAPLMAFLSMARALHHEANLKEDAGDLPGAIAAIDRLVRAPRPHAGEAVPEVEEVLADAYARIAELALRARDVDAAERAAREGLKHAPDDTYFRGHLLEVSGEVDEARASELADAGKTDEAARARARAMTSLEEAVKVQEQVIGRALDGGAEAGAR